MGILNGRSATAAVVLLALIAGVSSRIQAQSPQWTLISRSFHSSGKAQEFYEDSNSKASDASSVESHVLKFKVDTAKLTVAVTATTEKNSAGELSALPSPVEIYFLSDYCHDCLYYKVVEITGEHQHYNATFLIDSKWNSNLKILANYTQSEGNCSIHVTKHFQERAAYTLKVSIIDLKNKTSCEYHLKRTSDPYHTNSPIAVAASILVALSIIYMVLDRWHSSRKKDDRYGSVERFINSDLGSTGDIVDHPPTPPPKPARERLVAVDSFRGVCIVIMVFVNYKGGRYWFFHHSPWHGLTVADLVFPWFMFIMGINIVFSIDSLVRKATPALEIAYKIFRRTLILFFLGLCIINHNTDFVNMRIPGVLQRFAVAYCIVTLLQWAFHKGVPDLTTKVVMETSDEGVKPWWYRVRDITIYWQQWIIIALFEVAWHCLTFLLPVPGCPTGYLGPGGLADQGQNFHCIGGAAGYIDLKVFGERHVYGAPTARNVYYPPDYVKDHKIYFDPEGLLGSFHSILIVFFGLQAGKIFLYYKEPKARIVRWLCWSLLLGAISAVLTKCSQNDGWIPVSKNLWSTSFVTTLSCFAFFILSVMYYIIDVKKWYTGVPFYFVAYYYIGTLSLLSLKTLIVLVSVRILVAPSHSRGARDWRPLLVRLIMEYIWCKDFYSRVPFLTPTHFNRFLWHVGGMNSIFIYVGHEVFEGYLPFAWGAGDTSTHGELLAMNMLGTAYWVLIAYYSYKIKFFVKI